MFFCVRARAIHHPELQQTTHARGNTSAIVSILATEQTSQKVKGGVRQQGQPVVNTLNQIQFDFFFCHATCQRNNYVQYFYMQFDSFYSQ